MVDCVDMEYTPQQRNVLQEDEEYQHWVRVATELRTLQGTNIFNIVYKESSGLRTRAITDAMSDWDNDPRQDAYNKGIVAGLDSVLFFMDPDTLLQEKAEEALGRHAMTETGQELEESIL